MQRKQLIVIGNGMAGIRTVDELLQLAPERYAITVFGAAPQDLFGNEAGAVRAVSLADGTELPADLVVMAIGIKPSTALAESAGLHCARGVVVNDTLQTYDPRIYAVGECVNQRGTAYGLVAPLQVVKDDKLVGTVLYGDTADGVWYFRLIREGRPIADIRHRMMFGEQSLGDTGHQGQTLAASLPDSMEICGCNGVSKGQICQAIKALRTVKTCVGLEWCRFGVQDSTALGIALERALWRMAAPRKVKLAVSGCPRNCAESGIKDVGVIGVDSGWEIYVAGHGGIRTEVAQFLVKLATAGEIMAEQVIWNLSPYCGVERGACRYIHRGATVRSARGRDLRRVIRRTGTRVPHPHSA